MRALVYLGPRRLEVRDVPDPVPGAGEARVRVAAAAICGSDLHAFREPSPRRVPPLVMGHEVVGFVEEVGEEVGDSLMGTRVAAMPIVSCGTCRLCSDGRPNLCPSRGLMGMHFPGAFAQAFKIVATQLIPLPERLSDAAGSLAEPFANSIHAVDRAVCAGDEVLVIGAGAIGLFAARAAALAGARRVFAVDPLQDRLELAAAQGAVPIRVGEAVGTIEKATRGRGVDVAIDAAGFPSAWELALEAARPGGRVEALGLGASEGPISYHAIVSKGIEIRGSYGCLRRDFERAMSLLSDGAVDVAGWITEMSLAEGHRAFEYLVDGARFTKVVLVP